MRPEDVRLAEDGFLHATVISRQFTGQAHLVRVRLADGTQVLVDQRGDGLPAEAGDRVGLDWDPAAMHIFPGGAAETVAADDAAQPVGQ